MLTNPCLIQDQARSRSTPFLLILICINHERVRRPPERKKKRNLWVSCPWYKFCEERLLPSNFCRISGLVRQIENEDKSSGMCGKWQGFIWYFWDDQYVEPKTLLQDLGSADLSKDSLSKDGLSKDDLSKDGLSKDGRKRIRTTH